MPIIQSGLKIIILFWEQFNSPFSHDWSIFNVKKPLFLGIGWESHSIPFAHRDARAANWLSLRVSYKWRCIPLWSKSGWPWTNKSVDWLLFSSSWWRWCLCWWLLGVVPEQINSLKFNTQDMIPKLSLNDQYYHSTVLNETQGGAW